MLIAMANLPKKLITLDVKTDAIATRVQYRQTKYGFSSWVRQRLIAWDRKQQMGYPEEPEVEILRLERLLAERHQVAWKLAEYLSAGTRAFVGDDPSMIFGPVLADIRDGQTWEDVVE